MNDSNNIFKVVYFFAKKYKFSIIFYITISFFLADFLSIIVNNYMYKEVIDRITEGTFSFHKDYWIFIIYIFTMNSGMLLSFLTMKPEYNFRISFKEDIKNYYFQKTLKNSINFFNDNMAGTLNSKIRTITNSSVDLIEKLAETLSISLIVIILMIIFSKVDNMLSILLFTWFCLYSIGSIYFMKKMGEKIQINTKVENESYGKLTDCFTNALSVKIFSRENFEKSKMKEASLKIKKTRSDYYIMWFWQKIFDYIGVVAIISTMIYITIKMTIEKRITIGELVFIIGSFSKIIWWLRYLARNFVRISEIMGEMKESLDVINNIPEIQDYENSKKIRLTEAPQIRFEDVNFKYKENLPEIFKNFNLTINPKEKIGLVGYTGSGKSTFINLLLRFYDTTSGKILIDNYNIKTDFTQLSLRKNISYIPQEPILFHRTIKENIVYGNISASEDELIEATKKAYCYDFIMELENGFDTLVGERGVKLSGGQKQRIAIARAILKNSPILILDEATSALDSITENYIQKALNNLMENKTVIVIAHRLSTLNNMDRIIVLDKGTISEDGTKNELLTNSSNIFSEMWKMQKDGVI